MAKKPDDIVASLYGSSIKFRHAVAFCKHHHSHLTATQVKTKGCLGKRCRYLDKFSHPYWEFRERKKQQKKERRCMSESLQKTN